MTALLLYAALTDAGVLLVLVCALWPRKRGVASLKPLENGRREQ